MLMASTALLAVAAAFFVYVLLPLFREASWPFLKTGELSKLRRARKEGLQAISDIDAEYEMGKLSQDDYEFLRKSLKGEVLPVLKRERDMAAEDAPSDGEFMGDGLKEDVLREVVRICGTKGR